MTHFRLIRLALGCALAIGLATAPAAMAGTIRYDIAESPAYTIDNESGIVKVSYNGCVTAGERQTIGFTMVTNASDDATVGFKVLREEGEDPISSFDPSSVTLVKNTEQTFNVVLTFTLDAPTDQRTTFRFKLDPDNSAGLGEGPGVMVTIPCVLAAAAPSGGFNTAPGPDGTTQPVPTSGVIGATDSPQAQGRATCIYRTQRVRLRAGERSRFEVLIKVAEQEIQGALVRVTLPGGRTVNRRTGRSGIAVFSVRPGRSGRAIVQTDVCFGVRRIAVLGVASSSNEAPAQFTG